MKAVPGILPTLLEMICFFSTPTIDVEPSFIKPPLSRGEVVHMVTHSELILIGQLIVSVLTLFVHIYNNKKK